jgi:pimeloyl-ACP methyl ester carboxylesterase
MLSYKKTGTGKKVLLLCHGFGEAAFIWNTLTEELSKEYICIIPSLPGCGESSLYENLSIESMAEDMYEIIKYEKINEFYFAGHSMGGYIGLAFAKKYELLLKGLLLINSTVYVDTPEKIEARKKTNAFISNNTLKDYLKVSVPNLYSENSKQTLKPTIDKHIELSIQQISKEALIAQNTAMIERPSSELYITKTALPIGFIIGRQDEVIPLEKSLTQSILPQQSYVKILNNIGHVSMQETNIASFVFEFVNA